MPSPSAVAALDHEAGDDAVEGGAVVEGLAVIFFWVTGSVQSLVPSARPMKLATAMGACFVEELAGEAAHGGVDDDGGAGGNDGRVDLRGGAGGVGEVGRRRMREAGVVCWGGGSLRRAMR